MFLFAAMQEFSVIDQRHFCSAQPLLNQLQRQPNSRQVDEGLYRERLRYVEDGIRRYLDPHNHGDNPIIPLDNGSVSLVFALPNNYVLKIKQGTPNSYKNWPPDVMLHPEQAGFARPLNIGYEVSERAKVGPVSLRKRMRLVGKALCHGGLIIDPHSFNCGLVTDRQTNNESLLIIDGGAGIILPFAPYFPWQQGKHTGSWAR